MKAEFKKWFDSLDKQSDEFFETYQHVHGAYWTFDKPDEDQRARQILNIIIERGESSSVEMLVRLYKQLHEVMEQNIPAVHGSFGVADKEYHFDIYTDKSALTNLEKMLRQTVMVKGEKQ